MTQFSGSVPVCLGLPLFWPCILFSHCMAFFAFAVAPFVHAICISWPHGSHVCASCSCCSRRNVLICFPIRIARFFLLLCHRLRLIVCCCCCHLFSLALPLSVSLSFPLLVVFAFMTRHTPSSMPWLPLAI